jgi:hypothetical protein
MYASKFISIKIFDFKFKKKGKIYIFFDTIIKNKNKKLHLEHARFDVFVKNWTMSSFLNY